MGEPGGTATNEDNARRSVDDLTAALAQLQDHGLHRRRLRPLVSVLVGPVGGAIHLWRRWRRAPKSSTLILREHSLVALCTRLIEQLCSQQQLLDAVLAFLSGSVEYSVEALRDRLTRATTHELELLYSAAGLEPAVDARDRLVSAVLDASRGDRALTAQRLPRHLIDTPACPTTRPLAFLTALQRLVPVEQLPAVLAVPGDLSPGEAPDELDRWARFLAQVSCEVPQLPLGLAVSEAAHSAYCRSAPESFQKAVLRDSVIRLPTPDSESTRRALESRLGAGSDRLSAAAEELARCGGGEALLESFVAATQATTRVAETPAEATAARSAAEAFLFDLLEHLPETAGHFELNLVESFSFGPRAAEIDLASRELGIAIEIDGHYHFTDASRYRRDRQKDFLLQRHGYLVLRFLAEDVVQEMFAVRDVILEAVRLRISSSDAADEREDP